MIPCPLNQSLGLAPHAMEEFAANVRRTCQCINCQQHRAQGQQRDMLGLYQRYIGQLNQPWPTNPPRPVEMTAADLGLSQDWQLKDAGWRHISEPDWRIVRGADWRHEIVGVLIDASRKGVWIKTAPAPDPPVLFPLMTIATNSADNPLDGTRLWDNS